MALSPCADDVEAKGNDVCDEAQWGQAGRPEEVHLPVLPDPSPRKTERRARLEFCAVFPLSSLLRLSLYVCTSFKICALFVGPQRRQRARDMAPGQVTAGEQSASLALRPPISHTPALLRAVSGFAGHGRRGGPGNRHVPLRAPRRARPRHAGVKPRKLLVAMFLLALCGSLL